MFRSYSSTSWTSSLDLCSPTEVTLAINGKRFSIAEYIFRIALRVFTKKLKRLSSPAPRWFLCFSRGSKLESKYPVASVNGSMWLGNLDLETTLLKPHSLKPYFRSPSSADSFLRVLPFPTPLPTHPPPFPKTPDPSPLSSQTSPTKPGNSSTAPPLPLPVPSRPQNSPEN